MEKEVYTVDSSLAGIRLDKYLSKMKKDISRSYLKKLIDEGKVLINDKKKKSSYIVKERDQIIIFFVVDKKEIKPVEMKLNIIFEDRDILVVNKPAGLVVHPSGNIVQDTLVNALLAYTDRLSDINGSDRPGIVHRLDKDTTGAMVIAKNNQSHLNLVEQFKERRTRKIYHTILKGNFPYDKGKIDAPIGRNIKKRKKMAVAKSNSKKAITYFDVLERFEEYTYLEVKLETGRTHQIRVHFAYMGYPVIGDAKYGKLKNNLGVKRQLLHAYQLGLFHPINGNWLEFKAPFPDDFMTTLKYLRKKV